MEKYYSHGKLLLTGEYAILDGALGLALPTKLGQSMEVKSSTEEGIHWRSYDHEGHIWYENKFKLDHSTNEYGISGFLNSETKNSSEDYKRITENLSRILLGPIILDQKFVERIENVKVECFLEFNRTWGLGSSSTLIGNIAQWAKVDPYSLLQKSMGGSGYDVACARADGPILYQVLDRTPSITRVEFDPPFKESLCFVYLNRKQKSDEAIVHYRETTEKNPLLIEHITRLTEAICATDDLEDFEELLEEHESILAHALQLPQVKEQFPDYPGTLKSLGAWGGDFVLATRAEMAESYFKKKGFTVVIPYSDLIL